MNVGWSRSLTAGTLAAGAGERPIVTRARSCMYSLGLNDMPTVQGPL